MRRASQFPSDFRPMKTPSGLCALGLAFLLFSSCSGRVGDPEGAASHPKMKDSRFQGFLSDFRILEPGAISRDSRSPTKIIPLRLNVPFGHTHHEPDAKLELSAIPLESGELMIVIFCVDCAQDISGAESLGVVLGNEGGQWSPVAAMMRKEDCVRGPSLATRVTGTIAALPCASGARDTLFISFDLSASIGRAEYHFEFAGEVMNPSVGPFARSKFRLGDRIGKPPK